MITDKDCEQAASVFSIMITTLIYIWSGSAFLNYVPQGWWTVPALLTFLVLSIFLWAALSVFFCDILKASQR